MVSAFACFGRFHHPPRTPNAEDATFAAPQTRSQTAGIAQNAESLTATSDCLEKKHVEDDTTGGSSNEGAEIESCFAPTTRLSLLDLENDVLESIFARLSGKDVGKIACACKSFHGLTHSNEPLWRGACERDFKLRVAASSAGYRDLYVAQVKWRTKEVAPFVIKTGRRAVSCVAFTDKLLLTGGADSYIRVWDVKTGEKLRCLVGHGERVCCLQVHDGKILSGSSDSTIRIWRMDRDEIMPTVTLGKSKGGHDGPVYDLKCGGGLFASGSFDCSIKLWNLEKTECIQTFEGHTRPVYCVDLDAANNRVVSGSDDATVRVWNTATGGCDWVFDMDRGWARALRICGEFVITGGNDGTVGICRVGGFKSEIGATGSQRRKTIVAREGHGTTVLTVEVQGGLVITGHADGVIALFDMLTGKKISSWKPGNGSVFCTAASQTMMVTGFQRGDVHIRNFL
ncbi:hypothetical protein BSKO_03755 [Bryopsis sp. KO-2023]|nr:hypothetical protein BSKO_03755 [Bryopsis sp. KO-2023]